MYRKISKINVIKKNETLWSFFSTSKSIERVPEISSRTYGTPYMIHNSYRLQTTTWLIYNGTRDNTTP